MRSRKRLVKVEVNDVHAHVAGPRDADECVHVGAVHVNETAGFMNDVADLFDVALEESERVWVGQHQSGNIAVRAEFAQVFEIC